ncbi:MAG TPA: hypothetical protein VGC17_03100 [Lactovum miscens]|uniref:hypothetical protein n=1 Tax=Lactovum miscens TaxID=190387 RepID=UPI002EDA45D8
MVENNIDYIALATKYGGYMETDRVYLENRLSTMSEAQKMRLLLPPPSVINAYFTELYQKRNPQEATSYFFGMSQAFGMFFQKPAFGIEGLSHYELFRFIRLNIDGKAYGFSYINEQEEAIIFSELPEKANQKFMLNLSQIFPQYVIFELNDEIHMKPKKFERFVNQRDLTTITSAAENETYIKFYGYNIDELIEQGGNSFSIETLMQYDPALKQFIIYQNKGVAKPKVRPKISTRSKSITSPVSRKGTNAIKKEINPVDSPTSTAIPNDSSLVKSPEFKLPEETTLF